MLMARATWMSAVTLSCNCIVGAYSIASSQRTETFDVMN